MPHARGVPRKVGCGLGLLLAVAFGAAATGGVARAAALFPGPRVGTGESPQSPVAADFDGDGRPDLAVADSRSGDVTVALARGDGFGPPRRIPAGITPVALAAADFDGDGRIDLAVADEYGFRVAVLAGRGDGDFDAPIVTGGSFLPSALAAADLDGDGRPDLVVADATSVAVTVLLGRGDGSFLPGPPLYPGAWPAAVAVADVDGDGRLDVVVAGGPRVAVLPGRGDGGLGPAIVSPSGVDAVSAAVADVDRDGVPDLLVGAQGDGCDGSGMPMMAVLRGLGNGMFAPRASIGTAAFPAFVAAADVDGDGRIDLLAVREECGAEGRGALWSARGLGDGTFATPVASAAGYFPEGLAVADRDADGRADAVVACPAANQVVPLRGRGDGLFEEEAAAPAASAVGEAPTSLVAADFDEDGRMDLAVAGDLTHDVTVLLGRPGGGYAPGGSFPVGAYPQSLLAEDLNGDGHLDLLADDRVLLGRGDGGFDAGPSLAAGYRPLAAAAGDLDGDGRPDLAIADVGDFGALPGAVSLFRNAGGHFESLGRLDAGRAPVAVVLADLDGDGRLDLAAADAFSTDLAVFAGLGDGGFAAPRSVPAGLWARALLARDVDADGIVDLVAGGLNVLGGGGTVSVLAGRGDGSFEAPALHVAGPSAYGLAAADLDGDGLPDLVATAYEADTVSILLNRGGGRFAPQAPYVAGDAPAAVAAADLDGDGRIDLAVADSIVPGAVTVLRNAGPFPNRAPRAVPAAAATVECAGPGGTAVTLDGRGSSDPDSTPGTDDDLASYEWLERDGAGAERLLARGAVATVALSLGSHDLSLRVTDRSGARDTAAFAVRVVDTTPPRLAVAATPAILWPPAHQMEPVRAHVTAADACGPVTVVLVSVVSSEPEDAPGADDGRTAVDIAGATPGSLDVDLLLRAERAGRGPGRAYTLVYRATDASGNVATAAAVVSVPRALKAGPGARRDAREPGPPPARGRAARRATP